MAASQLPMGIEDLAKSMVEAGTAPSIVAGKKMIKDVFTAVSAAVVESGKVGIPGFGGFTAVKRAARSGKVPGTDKTYNSPATMVPKFTPAKVFKDAVAAKGV